MAISEFLLSSGNKYVMNAVARTDCKIIKLAKCNLMKLLKKNNGVVFDLFRCLSDRLSHEYVMLFNNSSNDSLHKVRSLLDYYKKSTTNLDRYSYCVPLTRQQMANLSGMRVEKIIRTVKKMEKSNITQIKGGKIFY